LALLFPEEGRPARTNSGKRRRFMSGTGERKTTARIQCGPSVRWWIRWIETSASHRHPGMSGLTVRKRHVPYHSVTSTAPCRGNYQQLSLRLAETVFLGVKKKESTRRISLHFLFPMSRQPEQRRLKVLVITTDGSDRQKHILDLFSSLSMEASFEPPIFSPSVSSRTLRNRFEFFRIANEAGLIPAAEWEALLAAHESGIYETKPEKFFDCLSDVPVTEGRRGSKVDVKLHYSREVRNHFEPRQERGELQSIIGRSPTDFS